ncbi:aminotransferase A [Texcoconibacillus texcoconensis]|uniref:Aminotransferase n=1 Tax=Texcoconibacillus texcoconensis TaxID=1095777 RepID=A0A840QQL2_9BACI|nr:aminotransferase A [Texcoconibacillus texcoconensis]MBB5173664.1 aminotransferase [Texcoconibacillus texcoconensis]
MQQYINPNVKELQISGIRQFFNRVSHYPDAVQLTIGQPNFPTPDHVKQAGIDAIQNNETVYTKNAGDPELLREISSFMEEKYGLFYDPESEIITTVGASQAIDVALRTILEPGVEVIMPAPVYPAYASAVRLAGATPVYVDTRDSGFKMTAEQLRGAITERTRCVIIPYPSNPTGVVLSKEELKAIVEVLKEEDIFILSDEIYSELVYDTTHESIASFPELKDKTIVINGVSKSHSMTGWRIGFLLAPAEIQQHMLKVHQYNVSCATSISQKAALQALRDGRNDPVEMRNTYRERRDYTYQRLRDMGLEVEKPEGAFYILPSIKKLKMDSFSFAVDLLEKERVAVVPGNAFSDYGDDYIRISYVYDWDTLKEGLDRLERYVKRFFS